MKSRFAFILLLITLFISLIRLPAVALDDRYMDELLSNCNKYDYYLSGTSESWLWPLVNKLGVRTGYVTQEYKASHVGLDISTKDTPAYVRAAKTGTVIASHPTDCLHVSLYGDNCNYGMGNYVQLLHPDGTYTVYMHMVYGTITVNTGQTVTQGTVLGQMGSSGSSTGAHLHFQAGYPSGTTINTNPSAIDYINTVPLQETETVYITGILLDGNTKAIEVGTVLTLTAKTFPSDVQSKLLWKSSNTEIVSVNANGTVTAHKVGSAVITASDKNNSDTSAEIIINVLPLGSGVYVAAIPSSEFSGFYESSTMYRTVDKTVSAVPLSGYTVYNKSNIRYGDYSPELQTTADIKPSDTILITGINTLYCYYHYRSFYDGLWNVDSVPYGLLPVLHSFETVAVKPQSSLPDMGGKISYGGRQADICSECASAGSSGYKWWFLKETKTLMVYRTREILSAYYHLVKYSGFSTTPQTELGSVTETVTLYRFTGKKGDMDCNGITNVLDAISVAKRIKNYSSASDYVILADIDGDRKLTASDLTSVMNFILLL